MTSRAYPKRVINAFWLSTVFSKHLTLCTYRGLSTALRTTSVYRNLKHTPKKNITFSSLALARGFKTYNAQPVNLKNEEITSPEVRVIGETGENLGILHTKKVLLSLDKTKSMLVLVDEGTNPPTCRIFSKEQLKEKEKIAKATAKVKTKTKTKMIEMKSNIGQHDLELKLKKIIEILSDGHRVDLRISIRKKVNGKEVPDNSSAYMDRIINSTETICSIVKQPTLEGSMYSALLQGKAKKTP